VQLAMAGSALAGALAHIVLYNSPHIRDMLQDCNPRDDE